MAARDETIGTFLFISKQRECGVEMRRRFVVSCSFRREVNGREGRGAEGEGEREREGGKEKEREREREIPL